MRAAGGPDVLEIADVPAPRPGDNELLVRVVAAGLSGADLVQRRGRYPPPPGVPADLLGLEYAGEVAQLGDGARRFRIGDRVMGIVGGAGQAEFVVTHEDLAMPVPAEVSDLDAGGIPEAWITAHDALFAQGRLANGDAVLVHAVGSGVGTAAAQLAKTHGHFVVGTSRSAWKLERAMPLGVDVGVDAREGKFSDAVLEATQQRGAGVILDFVGAAFFDENIRALAPRGRLVFLSTLGGADAALSIRSMMRNRLTLVATTLRPRSAREKAEATRSFADYALPLFESGELKVPVDKVFKLEEAAAAHRYLEEGKAFGKVVFLIAE